jgi:predicted MFS family arabinose efflux permease
MPLPPITLLALAVGVSVANPFYSQSLLPPIAIDLGLSAGTAVLVPASTQCGLAVSLLLLAFGASSLIALAIGMACLDLGVQGTYVAHQTTVFSLDAAARTRLGTWLFFTAYLGAALCSQLVARYWVSWQWHGTTLFAASLVLLALLIPASDGSAQVISSEGRS